jgi:hypothetical protein
MVCRCLLMAVWAFVCLEGLASSWEWMSSIASDPKAFVGVVTPVHRMPEEGCLCWETCYLDLTSRARSNNSVEGAQVLYLEGVIGPKNVLL